MVSVHFTHITGVIMEFQLRYHDNKQHEAKSINNSKE